MLHALWSALQDPAWGHWRSGGVQGHCKGIHSHAAGLGCLERRERRQQGMLAHPLSEEASVHIVLLKGSTGE